MLFRRISCHSLSMCLCSVPFRSARARLVSTVCLGSRALVVTKDDHYYDEDGPVWKGMMAQVESMPTDQRTKNKCIREFKNWNIRMMDEEKAKKEHAFLRNVKQEERNAVVETKQVAKPPLPTSTKVRPTKPRITKGKSSPPPKACIIKKEVHHLKAARPPAPITKQTGWR